MVRSELILITKASGDVEAFEPYKLENSLRNAGADDFIIDKIISETKASLFPGQKTGDIYKRAFQILNRHKKRAALKYKLKQAIFEMGPSGYPFEHLIAEIYIRQNYDTEVGKVVQGKCVSHEIDVIARNNEVKEIIECKYSENQGKQVSVQVPLYFKSRFDDVIITMKKNAEDKKTKYKAAIFTNTRFSLDSIAYSKCVGIKLVSWDYPQNNGLKEMIENTNIWPVTILTQLSKKEKKYLIDRGIVSCLQLFNNIKILEEGQIKRKKANLIIKELEEILGE